MSVHAGIVRVSRPLLPRSPDIEAKFWVLAIRASHISSVGKLLGVSNNEKIADAFHNSGAANMCPPDNSAHISAHNAVKIAETEARHKVTRQLRLYQQQKLEQNYQKAVRRAEKKGRKLPPRDQYYDHWGYSYFSMFPPRTTYSTI